MPHPDEVLGRVKAVEDRPSSTGGGGPHTHPISDVTGLQTALDGKAASSHAHAVADTTGLQTALDGKAASLHAHAIADTTGLQTALDGKASTSHGHAIADTSGLQGALDAKQAALVSGTNIKTVNGQTLLGSGDVAITGGSGDVVGPASSVDGNLALFNGTTGKLLKTGVTPTAAALAFLASPTSANMSAMLSDETGTGANVFGTAPTITNPVLAGTNYMQQGAQTSKSAAATLTIAELLTGIIQYTGSAANLTLPTGTLIEGGVLAGLPVDRAFEFIVINTGSGAATMVTNTGLTTVGSLVVTNGTSARFRVRKTATNTYTVYRV